MLCTCLDAINRLTDAFSPLSPNLNAAVGLNANMNAAAGLAASANAALSAHASAAAQLGASFSLGFNASIMAQLTALASFNASLRGLGINLTSPSAADLLQQLFDTMVANALAKALEKLPVHTLPQLSKLANLANTGLNAQAGLGIDLSAGAAAALQLQASLNAAASGAVNLSAAAMANASLGAFASMMASVQAGFGINLAAPGGMDRFNDLLGPINNNLASMPPFGSLLSAKLLKKIMDLLDALDAIKKGFDVDLLEPGAGKSLNKALERMHSKSKDESFSKDKSFDKSKSFSDDDDFSASATADAEALADAGFPGRSFGAANHSHRRPVACRSAQ